MELSSVFPSNYLKASDLQGRAASVTIRSAAMERMGNDNKLVLYFSGKEKGLICNKTNANTIAKAFGTNTDSWAGANIELFEAQVDFKGDTVPAIRVRIAPPRQAPPATAPAAPAPVAARAPAQGRPPSADMAPAAPARSSGAPFNDEIPFAPEWRG